MNKRQKKKKQKKQEMFIASFVSSYRELRKEQRWEHEYFLKMSRQRQSDHIWDMYIDEFEDAF